MEKMTVLSERKTKAAVAMAGLTLDQINQTAKLGTGYISRKWGSGKVQLDTLSRVASVIGCSVADLIEEVEN